MDKQFIEIVCSAKAGSETAFEALYNMTKDSAYFIAVNIAQNEQDAQDILQDSYMKAFDKINTVNPPEMFDNWLNKIVANTAKNYIRKHKPLLFDEINDTLPEKFNEETNSQYIPHQYVDDNETSRLIMEIINKLPEDKRLCVLMYYYQEMSISEIASAIEISEANVKYRLYTARKIIKEEIESLEKNGTKLYAAIPLTAIPSLIGNAAKTSAKANTAPAYSAISSALKAAVSASNALTKTSGGINMIFKTTAAKIIAAALAVAIVGGGVTVAIISNSKSKEVISSPANVNSQSSNSTASDSDGNTSSSDSSQDEENESVLIEERTSDPLYDYRLYNDHVEIIKYKGKGTETNVQIPSEFEHTPVTVISKFAFNQDDEDENIESISIPEGVTSIEQSAFYNCKSLTSISLPSTLKSIGHGAFGSCVSLQTISLPESVTELGQGVFDGTAWYENQPNGLVYLGKTLYAYKGDMPRNTSIDIIDGTKCIGGDAFRSCKNLINVTIPNSVETIGYGAFSFCEALTNVKLPSSVTKICVLAFESCTALTSIDIPDTVKTIQVEAFRDCNSLTNITIGNGINTIPGGAFMNCSSLTSVKLPNSLTTINNTAFQSCTALTSIEIPYGAKEIDDSAFSNCTSLANVKLPDTVTSIEFSAFSKCKALKSIEIPNSVQKIANYAFEGCTSLESITIPNSVKELGKNIFKGCKSVTIYGKSDSEAEEYAKDNDIKFVAE